MADTTVAKRYAKSFLGLVAEQGQLESAFNDMLLVQKTTTESRELVIMFRSPVVSTDKKVSILESIYGKHLSKASLAFLTLITKKRREGVIPEIADSFVAQYKAMKGITTAVVTSASVLTDDAKKRIQDIVQKEVGGTVELQTEINPELIGGFVLRIGDKQLDTSILSKIGDLRQEFMNSSFSTKY